MSIESKIMELSMNVPTWVGLLVGFLGGSVSSWGLGLIRSWWMRPILSVRILENKGCYVTTSRGNPPTHQAKFLRLRVENVGRSSVQSCTGYVTCIRKQGLAADVHSEEEVLELNWAHGSAAARNIPPGVYFYLDVASLDVVPTGPPRLLPGVKMIPNHLIGIFSTDGDFEFHVKIAAENTSMPKRIVRFGYRQNLQDLEVKFD